jgi:hypothetical protein
MTENVKTYQEFINEDHRQTIHELVDTVGISYGVCQEILTGNLNKNHTAKMFVPLSLENNQKQRHINVRLEL